METPRSSRRRAPKWLQPTRRLDITPETSRRSNDASPETPSMRHSIDFDEYDNEGFMPSTQGYGGSNDEVFWNYDASPQNR